MFYYFLFLYDFDIQNKNENGAIKYSIFNYFNNENLTSNFYSPSAIMVVCGFNTVCCKKNMYLLRKYWENIPFKTEKSIDLESKSL